MATIIHTDKNIRIISPSVPLTPVMWFDRSNDRVVMAGNPCSGQGVYTIVCEFFCNVTSGAQNIHAVGVNQALSIFNGGLVRLWGSNFTPSLYVVAKTWHTAILTLQMSPLLVELCLDGTTATAITPEFPVRSANMIIGHGISSYYYNGVIRDVLVIGRALSSAEKQDPYAVVDSRLAYMSGGGVTNADWIDQVGGRQADVQGSPEQAFVLPNGGIIKNGVLM